MTLMEELVDAGYSEDDFYHHCSDLYVYATPLTLKVINGWFETHGLGKDMFVSLFRDQITGAPMYDIAFQYSPYWRTGEMPKEEPYRYIKIELSCCGDCPYFESEEGRCGKGAELEVSPMDNFFSDCPLEWEWKESKK